MGYIAVSFEKKISLNTTKVKKLIKQLQELLGFTFTEITIDFISDENIRLINKKFLDHDYATDVITFNYNEKAGNILEGEIIISYDTAAENAKLYNVNAEIEYIRLIIHGILHLIGFDDKSPAKKRIMKKKEDSVLEQVLTLSNYKLK